MGWRENKLFVYFLLNHSDYHAYHYQSVQELLPRNYEPRVNFAQTILNLNLAEPGFIDRILWTDEATFTRRGSFNVHNNHYWADHNPHVMRERSFQYEFRINVWAALINDQIIGPHFLPNIMNGAAFVNFLNNDLVPLLHEANVDLAQIYFQQDGAPPHYYREARRSVNHLFGNHWVGRLGREDEAIQWPARSPDLTPLDFFCGELSKTSFMHSQFKTLLNSETISLQHSIKFEAIHN